LHTLSPELRSQKSSIVISSVITVNSEPLLRPSSDPSAIVDAIRILNSADSISPSDARTFIFADTPRVDARMTSHPPLKEMLVRLLPELKHRALLDCVLELIV
jgi:hypothetical protein